MIKKNLLIYTMLFSLAVTGCKKEYEYGPRISLLSRTKRVSDKWTVEQLMINGVDQTGTVPAGYSETYTKDGNYSYTSNAGSGSGKWTFQNNDLEIKVSGVSGKSSETLYILKLKGDHFWYYVLVGSDKYEYHMVSP
jgi:hypothetical protein